jgi:hypothetical protein
VGGGFLLKKLTSQNNSIIVVPGDRMHFLARLLEAVERWRQWWLINTALPWLWTVREEWDPPRLRTVSSRACDANLETILKGTRENPLLLNHDPIEVWIHAKNGSRRVVRRVKPHARHCWATAIMIDTRNGESILHVVIIVPLASSQPMCESMTVYHKGGRKKLGALIARISEAVEQSHSS